MWAALITYCTVAAHVPGGSMCKNKYNDVSVGNTNTLDIEALRPHTGYNTGVSFVTKREI